MILRSIYIILLFFICSCSDLPSGFIYINDIDKTIQTDLRYSTKDNFTGRIEY